MHSLRVGAFAFALRSVVFKPTRWVNVATFSTTSFTEGSSPSISHDFSDIDKDSNYSLHFDSKTTIKPGTVYFVSTPIGNLDDISVRAMKVIIQTLIISFVIYIRSCHHTYLSYNILYEK